MPCRPKTCLCGTQRDKTNIFGIGIGIFFDASVVLWILNIVSGRTGQEKQTVGTVQVTAIRPASNFFTQRLKTLKQFSDRCKKRVDRLKVQ